MTERELYRYRDAKREEERRRLKLREFEARMNSPRSPIGSPTPPDHSGDPSGKLIVDIERKNILIQKVETATRETDIAEVKLDAARQHLISEAQRVVFDVLYYGYVERGITVFPRIKDAAPRIAYSLSNVYRIRRQILDILAPISV